MEENVAEGGRMLRRTLSHRILLLTVAAAALVFTPAAAGTADPDVFSAGRNAAAWSVHARLPDARTPAAGPLIAAHRGASKYAPENTMAAFRLAETMGANFIELDVRATRDGRLIALHDETVDRTTNGKGRAGELTFGEIRRLDAGGWFSPAFRGERIPSLEEVLDRFGGGIGLILELKQPSAYPGIEQALARLLTERGLDRPERGRIIIQSFDTGSLRRVRELLPNMPIAVLVRPRQRVTSRDLAEYRKFADAVHLPGASARKPVIRRIQSCGLSVMVWNIHGERQARRLLRYGVDGILTDDPLLLGR
ncbi:MAG: glycerophosphodiester phosphodiesterase [Thermobacillus sp.]|nr:MAG: glycerophosphodiester phosphodiesterase [Thermobacillus sp.]